MKNGGGSVSSPKSEAVGGRPTLPGRPQSRRYDPRLGVPTWAGSLALGILFWWTVYEYGKEFGAW